MTITYSYLLHRLLLDSVPPSNGSKTSNPFGGDDSFESKMVIILVAFLGALICVVSLNPLLRCARQCTRRLAADSHGNTVDGVAASLTSTGVDKEVLRRIPVVVYRLGARIPATDCTVCLGEFREGERLRILPRCNHGFHGRCIDKWLVLHSSCPTCRQPLVWS